MPISPYIRDLRAVVGHARLLMPSVAGIVRDAEGRVLLVQQKDDGTWTTPGGAVELEDTPAEAVVREVWEETGLFVVPRRLMAIYGGPHFVVQYSNGDETQYISSVFECDVVSGELRADDDEVGDVRFWSLADATQLPLSPWLVRVLPRLFERDAVPWFEPSAWRPPAHQ